MNEYQLSMAVKSAVDYLNSIFGKINEKKESEIKETIIIKEKEMKVILEKELKKELTSATKKGIENKIKLNEKLFNASKRMQDSKELFLIIEGFRIKKLYLIAEYKSNRKLETLSPFIEMAECVRACMESVGENVETLEKIKSRIEKNIRIDLVSLNYNKETEEYTRLAIMQPNAPRMARYKKVENDDGDEVEILDLEKSGGFRKMPHDIMELVSCEPSEHDRAIKRKINQGYIVVCNDRDYRLLPEWRDLQLRKTNE